MRLIILGASGAGKGTQAKMIAEHFNISHISTGDLLRDEVKRDTALCRAVGRLIDRGYLLPDELMLSIVEEIVEENNVILDGFPRTIHQAVALNKICKNANEPIDMVLHIYVPDEVIIKRITGRKVCPDCGLMYHMEFYPPKNGNTCDSCKTELIQRVDDIDSTVRTRLQIYHEQTEPVIDYYEDQGLLITASGLGEADDISKNLITIMEERQARRNKRKKDIERIGILNGDNN